MKLLIISQYFWPENFRINDLAKALVERGHEVTVLTGKPNYPAGAFFSGYGFFKQREEQRDGVTIKRVPLIPRGHSSSLRLIFNYLSFVFFASLLAPFRCRDNYDLIFVYEPSPITVALPAIVMRRLKKIPMMLWVQDLWPESLSATGAITSPKIISIVRKLVRFIYRHCDGILVQSRGFIEPTIASGAKHEQIRYFPNWAEDLYRPGEQMASKQITGMPQDGFTILFAGNLGAAQSLKTIIDAAERLRSENIHWVILGDGRASVWMEEQIQQRGLGQHVCMLGRKPMEMMPQYFAQADALLVTLRPDPIFSRTIPSKVQSYLACGRPIVAALDGEGARIVHDSAAGVVVGAGDADALAKAVISLKAMSADEREQMGQRGRAYFESNFESEMLISQLEGWMEEMVEEGLCAS